MYLTTGTDAADTERWSMYSTTGADETIMAGASSAYPTTSVFETDTAGAGSMSLTTVAGKADTASTCSMHSSAVKTDVASVALMHATAGDGTLGWMCSTTSAGDPSTAGAGSMYLSTGAG